MAVFAICFVSQSKLMSKSEEHVLKIDKIKLYRPFNPFINYVQAYV